MQMPGDVTATGPMRRLEVALKTLSAADLLNALIEIEVIVGDKTSLKSLDCDLIRGTIARMRYRDINGS